MTATEQQINMQLCHCQPGGSRTFLPFLVEFGVCPPVLVSPGVSVSVNVVVVICFRKKFSLANWLTHQEYGHPSHADVVEGYGALKGILPLLFARGIILIPIDARCVCRFVQVEQLGILWEWEERELQLQLKFLKVSRGRKSELSNYTRLKASCESN